MAARAVTIYLSEMRELLEPLGYQVIQLDNGTKEIVYARGAHIEVPGVYHIPLSIRVYTSIVTSGSSRGVGEDAIRVSVWARRQYIHASMGPVTNIFMLGGSKRVHRVENWRNNLLDRLNRWRECLEPLCPKCGAPMTLKTPPRGKTWEPFYGCIRYPGCNGSQKLDG